MNEIAANQTPKNYWAARMIVFVVALSILCWAIPWGRFASYLADAGSNLSEFAILWLIGIHCLFQRRLRVFAFCIIALALFYLIMVIIAYGLEGSPAFHTIHSNQSLHHVKNALGSIAMCVADIMLLFFPRLGGWAKKIQYGAAVSLALRLCLLYAYLTFPNKAMSVSYSIASGAAYLALFMTSYFIITRREIMQAVTSEVAIESQPAPRG